MPSHASQMYAKNLTTFLDHLLEEGRLKLDLEDEITAGTLVTHEGRILNERIQELLGSDASGSRS